MHINPPQNSGIASVPERRVRAACRLFPQSGDPLRSSRSLNKAGVVVRAFNRNPGD